MNLRDHIRTIPDFPKPGILFRDVTTLFGHARAFAWTIDQLAERLSQGKPDLVAGIEARGFVLGGALATRLGLGFVPLRKQGKLPWRRVGVEYELEYGRELMEIHEDAVTSGQRVAIVDDLIATGGTGVAAIALVQRLGGVPCGFGAVIDLPELGGAERIRAAGAPVEYLIDFEGH